MSDSFEQKGQKWREYFIPRAELGDPDAQMAVGIGYANGEMVPKDLTKAEFWLRLSAERLGENAFFTLLKIFSREESLKTNKIFAEKEEWELGAIYLIYGRYLIRNGQRDFGRSILRIGWEKGNIISGISFIATNPYFIYKMILSPIAFFLALKATLIRLKNKDDIRIAE